MVEAVSAVNLPLLRRGSSGEAVRLLQKILIRLGANIQFDAQFGPRTEQAVKDFQQDNQLTVDGIIGPNTWRKLTDRL